MSDEYIKRWAKKLVGYKTKEGGSIFDLRNEIEDIIKRHLEKICGYVDENELVPEVFYDEEYFPEFIYTISCGDKKVDIDAHVYGAVYIEIDDVNVAP
jgi:hypothetical protein